VPEDRLADIRQRGRRLDERLPGEGLGIAIAADVAAAAGGGLEVRNGARGLEAVIDLPAARAG
jgi:signal transduction histidine kinase